MANYVVELDSVKGHFQVDGQLWTVGKKYKLLDVVGCGAYSTVCKGLIRGTAQFVAIKRMENVLANYELGKRVLREVCILRRLNHPNILALIDTFIAPSQTPSGTDVYIVTEYADKGSLYNYMDNLTHSDVKILMQQLLEGIEYLHSAGVWHRDIKSDNVLIVSPMVIKICDFNLSRSAGERPETPSNRENDLQQRNVTRRRRYTTLVVTRNYRAPEVIMSHGEYTSAIDMWSVGCIFWELLNSTCPKKGEINPGRSLFNPKKEEYRTPKDNEFFLGDHDQFRFQLLDGIFNVIGTPCWKDIENIPSGKWRKYLKNLPGKVGRIHKTLGKVEKEALDLLSRLLCFDPGRRCTAKEALTHEYFKSVSKHDMDIDYQLETTKISKNISQVPEKNQRNRALQQLEEVIRQSNCVQDTRKLYHMLGNEVKKQREDNNPKKEDPKLRPALSKYGSEKRKDQQNGNQNTKRVRFQ